MDLTVQYIFIMACLSGNYKPNTANLNAELIADHICFKLQHIVKCFFFCWGCVCVAQQYPDVTRCML